MTTETKVTLSSIAYFSLFALLNVLYFAELYPQLLQLDDATVAAISFSDVYFILPWAGFTLMLPLISYSFLHMRRRGASGFGYWLVRHFFITNLGFSAIGLVGIVYEIMHMCFH